MLLSKWHKGNDIDEEFGQKSKKDCEKKREGKKVFGTGLQKNRLPT